MKPKPQNQEQQHAVDDNETPFKDNTDICQQLMDRYAKSSAPQHRHLLATAAAMRSILSSESLPLTPPAYFAAAISAADSALSGQSMDPTAVSAVLTFLSIVLPLVPHRGIAPVKASEAVGVLAGLLEREGEKLGVASVRSGVKCVGTLLVASCDLEDWDSVRLGFESLLKFSIDKRPKIRRCAQECLEKVLKSFQSSAVINEASKLVKSLLMTYMPVAVILSNMRSADGLKENLNAKPQHVEVLHMLNLLNLTIPYLSVKVHSKLLSELRKLMISEFSPLTRQILKAIEGFIENSKDEVIIPEIKNIINSLIEYTSLGENNPADTVISAASLLKSALVKLHAVDSKSAIEYVPVVCSSLTGLLTSETSTASQASSIIRELINRHIDHKVLLSKGVQPFCDDNLEFKEANAIRSTCVILENTVSLFGGIPNEHILAVISVLFSTLGEFSYHFMNNILTKLAKIMNLASGDTSKIDNLQECVGAAVKAMGSERILALLPIILDINDFTCSNIWLVPILKKHVVGASLRHYMDHIVPLAKSIWRVGRKAKNSVVGQKLQGCARGLWELLPAYCHYPVDLHQNFGSLAELLIKFIKKYSFMHESIGISLQVLVNENKSILSSKINANDSNINKTKDSRLEFEIEAVYAEKTATRNIKALASCSTKLLQSLIDIFVDSLPGTCPYLKEAIGCLASITDSSCTKNFFVSLLEKLDPINGEGEFKSQEAQNQESIDKEQEKLSTNERHYQRCVIMDLASSLVEGAQKDLVDLIYSFTQQTFQAADEIGHPVAYHALKKILEEHARFCSFRFSELIDLLVGLKAPVDIAALRNRFACFHILMVHAFKMIPEETNEKAFLILNEIIVTLKDAKEEPRKAAYDVLLDISSSLRDISHVDSEQAYYKLISMIAGYLSGSSPHIKSGAVSALSVLVYKDSDICLSMPDLLLSLLSLLHSKANEVIKAVLGFVKVLVSSLKAKDLQSLLSQVANEILPWSSVSRHHFRSKVTIILEIMIRKCGSAAVDSVTPHKYKGFVKTVMENRRVKTSSKESPTDTETVPVDSSITRPQKRKRKELGNLPEEKGLAEHRKVKRGKHISSLKDLAEPGLSSGGGFKLSREATDLDHKNFVNVKPGGRGRRGGKDFGRGPKSRQKRKMEKRPVMKGGWTGDVSSDSKLRKQKKVRKT